MEQFIEPSAMQRDWPESDSNDGHNGEHGATQIFQFLI